MCPSPQKKLLESCAVNDLSIRDAIVNAAPEIGFIRLGSIEGCLNLKFKGLRFGDFIDRSTLRVDRERFCDSVGNNSRRHDLRTDELIEICDNVRSDSHNTMDVCCGHELLDVLAVGLRLAFGACDLAFVDQESLASVSRLADETA